MRMRMRMMTRMMTRMMMIVDDDKILFEFFKKKRIILRLIIRII